MLKLFIIELICLPATHTKPKRYYFKHVKTGQKGNTFTLTNTTLNLTDYAAKALGDLGYKILGHSFTDDPQSKVAHYFMVQEYDCKF